MVFWVAVSCAFFLPYYWYLRECLKPQLLYHGHAVPLPSGDLVYFPIYQKGFAFLERFLARPGGLSEYLGARYCQYYYCPNLGAFVITAVALLVYLGSDWLIRLGGGGSSRGLRFVPPLLLLIVYNQYTFQLASCLALVVVLMATVVYVLVANRVDRALARAAVFAVLCVAVYYAAGGMYVLLAVLCALSELLANRRYVLGGLYLVAAAGVPLLGKYWFDVSVAAAYLHSSGLYGFGEFLPGAYSTEAPLNGERLSETAWSASYRLSSPRQLAALLCLYGSFIAILVVVVFRRTLGRLGTAIRFRSGRVGQVCFSSRLRPVWAMVTLSVAGVSVAWLTLDRDAQTVLQANYCARMETWPEFLEVIDRYPVREYPASVMVDVNRALFETGQLGSRMFSYRQSPEALFRLGSRAASLKGGCEMLFRLGRINEAEHAALEVLEMDGERPETLRLLADVYIVKRRSDVARVFLSVLTRDVVQGPWAEDRLQRLDSDPLLSSDPRIRDARLVMPLTDMVTESKEELLLALLARNRKNRMAFEYLMAYYLLTRQPDKVALHIDLLNDFGPQAFGYPTVPEHYAEALLLYLHNVNLPLDKPPNLRGRIIRRETLERVRQVIQVAYECRNDKEAMGKILTARFPNSGCRYLLTGEAGGVP